MTSRSQPDISRLARELRAGHRAALARAITLIESRRGDHQSAARELVQALLPETGQPDMAVLQKLRDIGAL